MNERPIRVPARFCGPPGAANGGWPAGMLAEPMNGPVQVSLRRPVPLETDLTARMEGDTTGVGSRMLVAAPWIPDASMAADDGLIHAYAAWAALDCPGACADLLDRKHVPQVLGRIAGIVHRRPATGERCVVIGWPLGHDGRKHHVGTAIVDETGRACALARAT